MFSNLQGLKGWRKNKIKFKIIIFEIIIDIRSHFYKCDGQPCFVLLLRNKPQSSSKQQQQTISL